MSLVKLSPVFFVVLSLVLFSCGRLTNNDKDMPVAYCDAEQLGSTGSFLKGQGNTLNQRFKLGGSQSDSQAKSGRFSVELTKSKPYGFTYQLDNLKGGERYKASIWRYDPSGKAGLIVAGDRTEILYKAQKEAVVHGDDGWDLLEVEFEVPPLLDYIKIYAWIIDADTAWFDDMRIERLPAKQYPAYASIPKLHLYFDKANWNVLENVRERAFNNGVLQQAEGDWVKGIVSDEQDVLPVKARLKGDWLDHLEGEKWSYRIKMRKSTSLDGLKVFSLQNPQTRSNLMEYVAHRLFLNQNVLTTRYRFIPLYVNGTSRGIYALEEHFAKQLPEQKNRREGPLMRFNEDAFWGVQKYFKKEKKWFLMPYFQTAVAESFQSSKTLESPVLSREFFIAQALLYQYKTHAVPLEQIFDVDKLAKYWALLDLTKARHGMAWHNQRFYYNPVLCLLEPVFYDGYTEGMEKYREEKAIFGNMWFPADAEILPMDKMLYRIFQNTSFQQAYLAYLKKYSDENFLRSFFGQEQNSINQYQALLQQEFPDYVYDTAFLYQNARQIRKELPVYETRLANGSIQQFQLKEKKLEYDKVYRTDLAPLFVNAFCWTSKEDECQLRIENYYSLPLVLLGIANQEKQLVRSIHTKELAAYRIKADTVEQTVGRVPENAYLAFQVKGEEDVLYVPLRRWEKNTGATPRQELFANNSYKNTGFFQVKGDTLLVAGGKHVLNRKIVIPQGKLLLFEAGSSVDLIDSAAILSFSPVFMQGSKEKPVQVFSSDSTGMGISVFQTPIRNQLSYVHFENLHSFSYKGWALSGAVNFYQSDVDVEYACFESNFSEDALNIIDADFSLQHGYFSHIFSDAFDGDFVRGQVSDTYFENITNDAMDFSGSRVQISNCSVNGTGDKGVSAGENSQLLIDGLTIENALIGMASKDMSTITANKIAISNAKYGLIAFQKKAEYGPASISVQELNFSAVDTKLLIEKQSRIQLDKRLIKGTRKKLAAIFYAD